MVKTLLVNHKAPPGVDLFSDAGRCEPLPLTYLAAYLKAFHFPVEILDANFLGLSNWQTISEIKKRKPDIVGFSATTPDFLEVVKLAKKIKKLPRSPLIVIGGCHITALPFEIQNYPYFDFGVLGEGEATLLELVKKIKDKKTDFEKIKGLAFLKKGKLLITPPRPYIKNLDTIPFPSRELLPPLSSYHPTPGMYKKLPLAFMITSRGCPYLCLFCSRSVFGNQYRARSAKNIVEEMETLIKDFGVKEIRICDDLFCLNEERVFEVCSEIRKRRLKLSFGCNGRANLMTKKMLSALKKAGCWEVAYGLESANQEILDMIKKNLTIEIIKKAIKMTKESGLETRGFFMFGLPGDTKETMQKTIDFAKELNLDLANFYITIPFPGTELLKTAQKYGSVNKKSLKNYLNQTTKNPPFTPYGLTGKEIIDYYRKAYRQFYLRPFFLLKKLAKIRSFVQFKAYTQAFFSLAGNFLND